MTRLHDDDNEHGNGWLIEKEFFDDAKELNTGMGVPSETQLYSYDAFGRLISMVWDRELVFGPTVPFIPIAWPRAERRAR